LESGLLMPNGKKIEIIRRIQTAGYLCEIDKTSNLNLPNLKIENNPFHSFAFDFCGGMGVILELRITSDRAVQIQDFGDLELLGQPCNVDWWTGEKSEVYKFYQGPEFPRDVVLNHRIGLKVKPGQPLVGFLLGRSVTRIPSMYSHGFKLSLEFSILDGFDNPHTAQLLVQVDENLCSNIRRPIRSGLFGTRAGNKSVLVDGAEHFAPRREQVDTRVSGADPAEPQLGGTPTPRA
jgi:hypothetical protein